MKRFKRHKVKTEAQETSTSHNSERESHDLAYYIHDRVELMHQVFSVLKYKELKAMAPACIRHISLDDLQELCTEELLGISSKRLCAILDGAEPPSDTESSSPSPPPEQMETISLDSISSDEEILSQSSGKKKKHKHRRHSAKSKSKRKKSEDDNEEEADRSKASRAGLTVLELLELQARARAIRAQLQQEQQHKPAVETSATEPPHSSDNEVEIKEEPAEVVEISSDEEKPKVAELQKQISQQKETETQQSVTVTKRINDLVITVPQKTKQKIKLNRKKSLTATAETTASTTSPQKTANKTDNVASTKNATVVIEENNKIDKKAENKKDKARKKKKHKQRVSKDDIDNDEITLQLSDTEKMDLLEDLDRKNYDSVSSCSSSSSESSSESDDSQTEAKKPTEALKDEENDKESEENTKTNKNSDDLTINNEDLEEHTKEVTVKVDATKDIEVLDTNISETAHSPVKNSSNTDKTDLNDNGCDNTEKEKVTNKNDNMTENVVLNPENSENISETIDITTGIVENKDPVTTSDVIKDKTVKEDESQAKDNEKNLSEGELSDRVSSEIEALELKPEVVCISDEESNNKSKKKKKKKDKKSKKQKKSKKKSDFRESGDQNFYKDSEVVDNSSQGKIDIENSVQSDSSGEPATKTLPTTEIIDKVDLTAIDNKTDTKPFKTQTTDDVKSVTSFSDDDIEAVYEIFELSDDSSCCEVECSLLSKEPTTSEIEALSVKIDEIDRVEVITDREIREYERREELEEAEKISWKDRYLDSKKVKKVLTTANILNALRKKNKDLKNKLAESKKSDEEEKVPEPEKIPEEQNVSEEGSIEQFNTLEALTKYVDPVREVSKDLKKDAKMLLKMYKKLLKYNDINKEDDPSRKKKKKKKKKCKKDVIGNKIDGEILANKNDMVATEEVDSESNEIVNTNEINIASEENGKEITTESKTDVECVNDEVNSENREVNIENRASSENREVISDKKG